MKKIITFLMLMTVSLMTFSQQNFLVFGDSLSVTVDSLKARGLFVTDVFPQETWMTCCGKDFVVREKPDGMQVIAEYRTPEVMTTECITQVWREAVNELKEKYQIIYVTEKFNVNGDFCFSGAFKEDAFKVSVAVQRDGEIVITYTQW